MPASTPAQNFNGFIRPEIHYDANGNIILDGPTSAAAAAYGTKFIYGGLPANTPVPPIPDLVSTPVDNNGAGNTVVEGAAVNTAVGITAFSTSSIGNAVTYSLVGDTSGGGFKINANTGVVTVADASKINFETASHSYTITVQANDGILTASQSFVIGVADVAPTTPVDSNAAANTVAEGAAANTAIGVTASSTDINGPGVTWSLTADSSAGGFKIDPATGVISVADPSKVNYETAAHSYTVTARASDGTLSSSQTFTIAVTNVAPSTPVDGDAAANTVAEGAAVGSTVGVTASSSDPAGGAISYSKIGDTSGGGFAVDPATGVVTVADPSKFDFETSAPSHNFTVTVQSSDGVLTNSQSFTISVTDVAPTTPVDGDAAANTIAEGAAANTLVGVTASSTDPNATAVTYILTGDTSNGGFKINSSTGVVSVDDPNQIDFENSGAGHSYSITVQSTAGALSSTQNFTINVTNVNDAPVNSVPGAQTVLEDTSLVFSTANSNAITISDQDAGSGDETVTLTVGVGTLTLGSTASLTSFTNNAASITLTGTVANINAALNGLTYNSNPNGFGVDSLTVLTSDAGNTGPGGAKTDTDSFNINITAVNDAPVFTVGGTQNVLEDSGAHTVNGFITGIAPGPSNEAGQLVNFLVSNDNNALFSAGPTIDPSGNLTYTLAAHANGSATVTVQLHDNGGTANGGADTSGTQTFVINAGSVNDAPAGADNAFTILEGGSHTFTAAEFGFGDPVDAANAGGANAFQAVVITTLPGAGTGTLTLDTGGGPVAVTAGQTIPVGQIGGLVFTPATNANGNPEATFTFQVQDNGGTTNAGVDTDQSANTIAFNVTAVNDAPDGTDATIASVGAHTFTAADFGFTDPIDAASAGGANALLAVIITTLPGAGTGTLTLDTGGGPVAVTAGQSIAVVDIGGLVFTPVGNNSGTFTFRVQDNGGIANGGVDTDPSANTLTIIQNTPPVASDNSLSATEAGGLNNTVAGTNPSGNVILGTGSAGTVLDTDAEDASTALTVVAVHTGPESGSTGTGTVNSPLIGSHGTLTLNTDGSYTYTVNQSDSAVQALHTSADTITDQFNYTIQDTGGLQDTASLTFTIHGANDLPVAVADTGTMTEDDAPTSFDVIANDSQDPDSTASNAITLGPGGVTVTGPAGTTFVNTDATASIVSNQIRVTLNNSHFQQLALGELATVTVPHTLTGDAGDTSGANLVVTVNGVNDVPVAVDDSGSMTEDQSGNAFTVLTNDTLDADHSAPNNVTVNAATAVTNLSAPSGENIDTSDVTVSVNGSNQVVVNLGADFQHMKDGESTTFDVAYTLHGDQAGDTSTATLHVTVTGANDAPVAANFTFNAANSAIGNTDLVVNDPTDGAPDPAGPQKTISASIVSGASDVDGPGPLIAVAGTIATANGGSVTMQSDGDFIYKPPVGYTGSDSFTYQVSDQNAGASGVGLASGTITINVAAPKVWYVNAATGNDTTGDGSSEKPFASLAPLSTGGSADTLDGANDTIFLYNGTYNSGVVLENGQQLISQSQALIVNGTTLEAASGSNAVINGTVTLASGNTIDGIDFGNVSGFSLQDSGASVGTATVAHSLINNANGGAVNIANGGTLAMAFSSVTASGTSTSAIALNNTTGSFTAAAGTLNNGAATAADVAITGANNVNFTYDGSINDTTGTTVSISGQTGGTKDFNGAINGGAISLTGNSGATMSFDGGVTLSTGTANAFTATGGGTVSVTGANNTLTTSTGTTLNIANTTIGSGNVTFKTVSANGAVNAIVLNNTGTSGHLAVTGTGSTAGSGGVITNTTGDSISLTSTQDVSLSNMTISGSDGYGIIGHSLNGLVLNNDSITGSGDSSAGAGEGNIYLYELTGNASHVTTFDNLTVSNSYVHNVFIENTAGTLTDLQVTDSTFSNNGASTHAGDEFQIHLATGGLAGSPTATVHATHNTFSGNLSTPATFTGTGFGGSVDDGTLNVHIGDGTAAGLNTFDTNNSGITLTGNFGGALNFDVNNNLITHNRAVGVAINHFGTGTQTGFFRNNTIGTLGDVHSGAEIGDGLEIHDESSAGTVTLSVTGNIIQSVGGTGNGASGVSITSGIGSRDATTTVNVTMTNNTIRDIIDFRGLTVLETNNNGTSSINLLLQNNTFSNADGSGSNTSARVGGIGTDHVNVTQANAATLASDNGLVVGFGPGNTMQVDATVSFSHPAPPTPPATPQLATLGQGPGDSHVLTMDALAPLLAVALQHWAEAGASPAQLAQLAATQIHIADLPDTGVLANTDANGITIDSNAAGWGWFVDPTPGDNSEFNATASPTELLASGGAAAAHIDLLTVIEHEMGHVIGLEDSADPGVMNIALDLGERRLPDAADTALASGGSFPFAAAAFVAQGNHIADANVVQGVTATADAFVFANTPAAAPSPAQVFGTHLFQGDHFNFSALPWFHQDGGDSGLVVHALADLAAVLQSYAADVADPSAHAWPAPQGTGGLLATLFNGLLAHAQDLHL